MNSKGFWKFIIFMGAVSLALLINTFLAILVFLIMVGEHFLQRVRR